MSLQLKTSVGRKPGWKPRMFSRIGQQMKSEKKNTKTYSPPFYNAGLVTNVNVWTARAARALSPLRAIRITNQQQC